MVDRGIFQNCRFSITKGKYSTSRQAITKGPMQGSFGNCQRPVFSLGVSQHNGYNKQTVETWAQLVIEVARK